jgi:SAM-dependent methyltransferase
MNVAARGKVSHEARGELIDRDRCDSDFIHFLQPVPVIAERSSMPADSRPRPLPLQPLAAEAPSSPPPRPPSRPPRRAIGGLLFLLFLALAGSISTALWIGAAHLPDPRRALVSRGVWTALLLCVTLTTLNLMVRWFRWHFLIRRFTRQLVTRDSLAVYLATLPAIITPFFVGELVRVLILWRQSGTKASHLAWVWVIERSLDAAVLATFYLLVTQPALGVLTLLALAGLTGLLFWLILEDHGARNVAAIASVALVASLIAWILPALALVAAVGLAGRTIPVALGVQAFSVGTLFGGLSGFPLGVSVTGSTMIGELRAAGVATDVGVIAVLVYRVGTSFFAVALGVAAFLFSRERLARIMRQRVFDHFDEIAHAYEEEIPRHIRERLLAKKIGLMRASLRAAGINGGARGLDLGCGQGWYLGALADGGFRMHGIDYSAGQLRKAAENARRAGAPDAGRTPAATTTAPTATSAARLRLCQADAQALPFPDASFDFAYSINAFHHLPSRAAQERAVREIVRVLRPGGVFILHEINTQNPVFRLYVGYLFPLLKQIDEGTERWILPTHLPAAAGAAWASEVQYFTFTPDFVPSALQRLLGGVERRLEQSALRRYSAHYQACLVKDRAGEPNRQT